MPIVMMSSIISSIVIISAIIMSIILVIISSMTILISIWTRRSAAIKRFVLNLARFFLFFFVDFTGRGQSVLGLDHFKRSLRWKLVVLWLIHKESFLTSLTIVLWVFEIIDVWFVKAWSWPIWVRMDVTFDVSSFHFYIFVRHVVELFAKRLSFFNVVYSNNTAERSSNQSWRQYIKRNNICLVFKNGRNSSSSHWICQISQNNSNPLFWFQFWSIKTKIDLYFLFVLVQKFTLETRLRQKFIRAFSLLIRF